MQLRLLASRGRHYGNSHLLLRTVYEPPAVVLDLLQLVKLHGDVVDGELQQVPEARQVLGGGPRHGTGVLGDIRESVRTLMLVKVQIQKPALSAQLKQNSIVYNSDLI